jgi:hypothetical protein
MPGRTHLLFLILYRAEEAIDDDESQEMREFHL